MAWLIPVQHENQANKFFVASLITSALGVSGRSGGGRNAAAWREISRVAYQAAKKQRNISLNRLKILTWRGRIGEINQKTIMKPVGL